MIISRLGIVPGHDGLPIISEAVIRGDTAYVCGVTPRNPPVRACVGAELWRPGMLGEIMVTASR